MEGKTYLSTIYDKLQQDGFELKNEKVNDHDVLIATKKEFKLSWLATQLNIFVYIGSTDRTSKDIIETFSKNSLKYTIDSYTGLPRGVQSSVVSFSLLASTTIDEEAKQWVKKPPKKHFAAFEVPIIFDLKKGKYKTENNG